MKKNNIQISISDQINHLISTRDTQDKDLNFDGSPTSRLYFLTATFIPFEEKSKDVIPIMPTRCAAAYERFYVHMMSAFIPNYSRKPHLQPLAYYYIDYPFSKRNKSYAHLTDVQKTRIKNRALKSNTEMIPHIHSLMLIHPNTHVKFQKIIPKLDDLFRSLSNMNMSVDIRHLLTDRDLTRANKYSASILNNHEPYLMDSDLFHILPKSKSEPTYAKTHYEKEITAMMKSDKKFKKRFYQGVL